MFSGGSGEISTATLQAFRAFLPTVGDNEVHPDAELKELLTGACANIDSKAAAQFLGTSAADAGMATRGSGIHGGAARYTRAILGTSSGVGPLKIAATAFLFENVAPEDAACKWEDILNCFSPVERGR